MRTAEEYGAEALHARHLDAPYKAGRRPRSWVRVPLRRSGQVVVGGWTPADPRRPDRVGALLLGVPDLEPDRGLRYVGRAGIGAGEEQREVAAQLARLRRAASPFGAPLPAGVGRDAQWAEPRLVGRVEFTDWTADGRLRLPAWRGLLPGGEDARRPLLRPPDPSRGSGRRCPGRPPPGEPARRLRNRRRTSVRRRCGATEARRLEQHFVYNALNTIAALMRTDPARARELLLDFADLNRAADRPDGIPGTLGDELVAVRAYLQLEQARFGPRLQVEIAVDEELHALPMAPRKVLDAVLKLSSQIWPPHHCFGSLTSGKTKNGSIGSSMLSCASDTAVPVPTIMASK